MDKIYTDPNMENDNTEHIRRKRLSSILKAPRNPLDDLGHGNEMAQDLNGERRRRSSRRVSFANTIDCRVFQRDLKNNSSDTENKECSADKKNDVLTNDSDDPGAVPCEITGMNTLLHAPIQALGQETEWHDVNHATPRRDRQDTTLLFSEENEMDMTASHTAVIQRNLTAQQPEKTEKINFTSFLAKLHSGQAKAESSKELSLLSDPANHPGLSLEQKEEAATVKKIHLSELLLGLKPNKEGHNPAEIPDKENVCSVPSQGSGDVARPPREFGYSHEPPDTCDVTKVFRGQEGGMEMTKYEAADVKIPFPGISVAPPEQRECADVTEAFADEAMDMTASHTAKVCFALSTAGNRSLDFQKDVQARELDNPVLRRASNQELNVQQDPQLCADRKRASAEGRGDPPVLRAGKQARAVSAIQGSVSSEIVYRQDKTAVLSKWDNVEMSRNYRDIIYKDSTTEKSSSCQKICEKTVSTNPPLAGSRPPAFGDLPKGLAPGDNPAAVPYKTSALELPSASGGHMENVSQAHSPAAASTGFGSHTHLVASSALQSRFHPSAKPQLVFSGEKTVMFAGEDMDVTKTFVKDGGKSVDNERPTAVFTSVTCKPHFLGNRSTSSNGTEQEEMEITRCHTVVFAGQSGGITAEPKQMPCEIIPRKSQSKNVTEGTHSPDMDKENVEVWSIDGNIKRSQAMERNTDGKNSETQEKLQPVRAVSKVLPTLGDSERHFSIGKTGSSREDLRTPPSALGLLQRGGEEPVQARTSEPPEESPHLPFFGEESSVFLHSENMDMTGSCGVMVPDGSIDVLLSQNKAAPGCFGQGGNETRSSERGAMTTTTAEQGGQEAAAGGRTVSFALAQDMEITTTHTVQFRQLIPAVPADKTVVFAHDQEDMDITACHTVAVSKNICGFEAQQVPHTSSQQPPQRVHSELESGRGGMDSSQYATKPKDKPSIPCSVSSASAFPSEKGAPGVPSVTTPHSIYAVSLGENTMDAGAPEDHGLPGGNSVPASREQDLTPPEELRSKGVSVTFPSKGPMGHKEESGRLGSCVPFPVQGSDPPKGHSYAPSAQRNQLVEEDSARHEDSDWGLAEANLVPVANEESEKHEELSAEGEVPPKDFQINSEPTKQPLVSDSPRDQSASVSRILGICSKLQDLKRKSLSVSKTAASDQLPSSSAQPEDTLSLGKNTVSKANHFFDAKKQENTGLESGPAPIEMAPKDKYPGINIPLGIFQPKLPNKRNPVSSVQDMNTKPDRAEAPVPANSSETPGNKSSRQNFSPSQFIAEEFLPVCLEDTDSNDSLISELVESAWDDKNKKQIPHSGKDPSEEAKACNTKRPFEQKEEDLQSPKKARRDEHVHVETSRDLEVTFDDVPQDQAEVGKGGESPYLSAKSPECPQASTSSSLDSVKADTELTMQRSSQVESQLLTDSICEENLWEKYQSGTITVGEFFALLQVHVVIQKPRHSQLPASCEVSAPPTAEDLIYSQYVHRPKLRIYEEDCQDLSQKTVELKPHVSVLDQPLVHVNRSLWEVMRTCTDEELRNFGAELKKMKSCFTKEAKILSHKEKEILYRKLLQCAEDQCRKLQSRIGKVDDRMKEADSSVVSLESDSFWHEEEASGSAGVAGGQNLLKEMASITAQEEELLRELSEMDAEEEHDLAEMEEHRKTIKACMEILPKYDFTEWELVEWSEQQAVFNFLFDSVMLTVVFGPPIDGEFFASQPSRSIVSLDFESFLDEEQAPPSSCVVLRLILQFIESWGKWQEKCPTVHYLPQALFDISLVVNRCRILGQELEFLERWGAKFHILETDIKDTEVKLVFSSAAAFAKFELTLALSHHYPSAVLPFSVHTLIGNIGEKEIAAVLSGIPVGHHYLRRIVASINQNLLLGAK